MSFFQDNFKRSVRVSSDAFAQIRGAAMRHFPSKDKTLSIGNVVSLEPRGTMEDNQRHRAAGYHQLVECEYVLITSEQTVGDFKVFGFVRLNDLPRALGRLIDSLYMENINMRSALIDVGVNPDLVALNLEAVAANG